MSWYRKKESALEALNQIWYYLAEHFKKVIFASLFFCYKQMNPMILFVRSLE